MIRSWSEISSEKLYSQLESIFFETSSITNFSSQEHRNEFKYKYLDYYLENDPSLCYCAFDEDKIIAYILAHIDALADHKLLSLHPYMKCYEEFLIRFPAHLHINATESARGKGIGSMLIAALETSLKQKNCPGLHLVTGEFEENRRFYQHNNFYFEYPFKYKSNSLILLGKSLD